MATEVHLAVAGSGKTSELALRIRMQPAGIQSVALTYTTNAQAEIASHLVSRLSSIHETMGWFAFLVRHIVGPYLPAVFPGLYARGLCFVQSDRDIPRARSGWRYYLDDHHQPYSTRVGQLATKVLTASGGAPIKRLEKIYDRVYIDEVQDLNGNHLEILEALMQSKLDLFITGDVRQSVIEVSRADRRNRDVRGVRLVNWFRDRESAGLCELAHNVVTHRFNQAIADFSDLIHDPTLALPGTISAFREESGHDGVFLLDESDLESYSSLFDPRPTLLRLRTTPLTLPLTEILNFGASKGITRDRIAIVTTGPIRNWLKSRAPLAPASAAGMYVAVTRARFSMALVCPEAHALHENLHPAFRGLVHFWRSGD